MGYHGRSSSVVLSGTPFKRPCGQLQASNDDPAQGSVYGASKQMDFELEMVRGPEAERKAVLLLFRVASSTIFQNRRHAYHRSCFRLQGTFVGPGTSLGDTIDAAQAEDHIFGFCLLNDWSGA